MTFQRKKVNMEEQERDVKLDVRGEEEVADQEEKEPIRSEESHHIPHDSMVTVRLSEPPTITPIPTSTSKTTLHVDTNLQDKHQSKDDENKEADTPGILLEEAEAEEEIEDSPRITLVDTDERSEVLSPSGSESPASRLDAFSDKRESDSSDGSMEGGPGVNWEELERSEEQEPRNENSDDVSTLLPFPVSADQLDDANDGNNSLRHYYSLDSSRRIISWQRIPNQAWRRR